MDTTPGAAHDGSELPKLGLLAGLTGIDDSKTSAVHPFTPARGWGATQWRKNLRTELGSQRVADGRWKIHQRVVWRHRIDNGKRPAGRQLGW
ncbi:Uncharacterised protein [Mycobacteroides abscessus subsp. abscessus]|nr:Uncharacterised protein [Mycobacteroides abscessus subsp. abscessus]